MQTTEICPFCEAKFPLDKTRCPNISCNAQRVNDDNYDDKLKKK